jgi:murein DD-endopeptidase MepM/ murein hydrolase activator NlpD
VRIVRWFLGLTLVSLLAAGLAYVIAGKASGPAIAINDPSVIGQASTLDVTVDAPDALVDSLVVEVLQDGGSFRVFALETGDSSAIVRESDNRLRIRSTVGRQSVPELRTGPAQIKVTATRPVLRGLRHVSSEATRDVQVRLEPPRIAVASTHHYINVGGSELVVYRVTPPDVDSGVRVGNITYLGYPAGAAGVAAGPPDLHLAVFALPYDQRPDTPIELYARDAAGNEARAQFEHRVFPKTFRRSTIPIDDAFLAKVVPPILQRASEVTAPAGDLLGAFLKINSEMRYANNQRIAAFAKNTAPAILWGGPFVPMGGSQVESAFADYRTYLHGGREIDRQVHLGFDLAKTANAPVAAANRGKVLYANDLGIYGNTIIIDHGIGVQSLYGHLASFDVREGDEVRKGQTIGLSGQTGMAAGDHLHFSMLVNGHFVNATEWWDPHWIEDRIARKVRDAVAGP